MDLNVHVELAAETLFTIGPLEVTNSMLTMWAVMIVLIIAFWIAGRKAALVPGKFQSMVEMVVSFISDMVYGSAGKRLGRKILPLILGLFIFIWIANLTGLLPGVGTIGVYKEETHVEETVQDESAADEEHDESEAGATTAEATDDHAEEEEHGKVLVPFVRPPNADLNMTLAMALIAVGTVQVAGIRAHGLGGRIKHMADPPFLFPIEVIGELSRVVSLSARLFGNVFAGEVLLGVMFALGAALRIAIIPMVFPVVFLGLELLFGTIQALVFSLLTLIYITLAAAHGHEDEHAEAHEVEAVHQPAAQPAVGD